MPGVEDWVASGLPEYWFSGGKEVKIQERMNASNAHSKTWRKRIVMEWEPVPGTEHPGECGWPRLWAKPRLIYTHRLS